MARIASHSVAHPLFITLLAALTLLVVTAGCGKSGAKLPPASVAGSATDESQPPHPVDPDQLLREMAAVYKQATSYEDAGELHIDVVGDDGRPSRSPIIPFSVAFERPNKIRVHSLGASIVSNGKQLHASVDSLPGQVLVLPCPEALTIGNLVSDKLLAQAMQGQLAIEMPQLELLLADDPIRALAGEGPAERLPDENYAGEACHRVAIEGPAGRSVFWISAARKSLVKIEFPCDAFKREHGLVDASITAQFVGATLDGHIVADAFAFTAPEGAKLLSRLLPPPPEPPSLLLGKKPADFAFVDYGGGTVSTQSLEGKIVVLDMWATWCHWCFEGFPNLQQVYDQFQGNDKVAILAVNTDEIQTSDELVREKFAAAKLTIPIARDTKMTAGQAFKVEVLPTMVILGADGRIQDYHIGYDPNLATTLPEKINRLLAGEDLAAETINRFEKEVEDYKREEAAALVAGKGDNLR